MEIAIECIKVVYTYDAGLRKLSSMQIFRSLTISYIFTIFVMQKSNIRGRKTQLIITTEDCIHNFKGNGI